MTQILIVQLGSLGEIIHALPAARSIRAAHPRARLIWAVDEAYADLLQAQPWLDDVIAWDRRRWRGFGEFARRVRQAGCDVAIDFQASWRSGLLAGLSGAARRIGYRPSLELAHLFYNDCVAIETLDLHAVERNLALAARLTNQLPEAPLERPYLTDAAPHEAADGPGLFPLYPTAADVAAVDAWCRRHGYHTGQRLVVLNPDGSHTSHLWPPEKYTQLARRLLRQPDVRVVLVGGTGSHAICDDVAEPLGDAVWRADGRFRPLAASELLARAAVMVSGDSGLLHLAVAAGTPVVALFGPSHALRSGPYASDAAVLQRHLSCSPCFARRCPLKYDPPLCLDEISVERVFARVLSRLAQPREAIRRAA